MSGVHVFSGILDGKAVTTDDAASIEANVMILDLEDLIDSRFFFIARAGDEGLIDKGISLVIVSGHEAVEAGHGVGAFGDEAESDAQVVAWSDLQHVLTLEVLVRINGRVVEVVVDDLFDVGEAFFGAEIQMSGA